MSRRRAAANDPETLRNILRDFDAGKISGDGIPIGPAIGSSVPIPPTQFPAPPGPTQTSHPGASPIAAPETQPENPKQPAKTHRNSTSKRKPSTASGPDEADAETDTSNARGKGSSKRTGQPSKPATDSKTDDRKAGKKPKPEAEDDESASASTSTQRKRKRKPENIDDSASNSTHRKTKKKKEEDDNDIPSSTQRNAKKKKDNEESDAAPSTQKRGKQKKESTTETREDTPAPTRSSKTAIPTKVPDKRIEAYLFDTEATRRLAEINEQKIEQYGQPMKRTVTFRPTCYYSDDEHSGSCQVVYISNDNDLSCVQNKPDFSAATPESPLLVRIRMFEFFTQGWGPVVVPAEEGKEKDIMGYVKDPKDIVRGLLSGTHQLYGNLCWEETLDFGATTIVQGRIKFSCSTCPARSASSNKVERPDDESVQKPSDQAHGGSRFKTRK
ncbi:hypothetical protein BJ508DRAFT_314795 [Ascobolus immersus RN42]|uniref:Uncharacterized protein n=1 Tax=Ascobolus immersus RN42 TaxID=1160509 RepID=A0A3N4HDK9_ASCIM|nr:hypothetical protein BJ508DRAFT_314795 [Ascobolus immersus RN42]